jgi:hypothetical protein
MSSFQRGDGRADGRLRQVECLGGPGDMLALGDRHKNAKLFQCHTKRHATQEAPWLYDI